MKKSSPKKRPDEEKIKKISPLNYLMALRHSKQYGEDYKLYCEEYKKYSEENPQDLDVIIPMPSLLGYEETLPESYYRENPIKLSKPTEKFCRKYNLIFPVEPDSDITNQDEKDRQLRRIGTPVEVLFPIVLGTEFKNYPWGKVAIDKLNSFLKGRIILLVDTSYPRDQIRQGLDQFLETNTEGVKDRLGESAIDIWKVYRQKENEKKSFKDIASSYGVTDKDLLIALDRQVRRAYKETCEIIKSIEETARSRTT
jgi:hypothetical protein